MASSQSAKPKVAVVTRTQNRQLLLARAIESVQAQTFTNFIHIIVNDGGGKIETEKTIGKLDRQRKGDLRVLHNETALGHTKALNKGIKASGAEYVAILDDDDSWAPEYLEKMVGHLDATGAKGVVITSDYIVEKIENGEIKTTDRARYRPDITEVSLYKQCVDNCAPTMGFVYRRDVYDELGGYDETLGVAEDWEFTLRFLLKYDIDFINTDKAYAFYHYRPEAVGSIGNSVFANVGQHRNHLNMLANRYLREDVKNGRLGVGFIINTLRYQREREDTLAVPTLERMNAIEKMISFSVEKNDQLGSQMIELEDRLSRLVIVRTAVKTRAKRAVASIFKRKKSS